MDEKRQVRRTRVLKAAKILFEGHASAIDCTVRNLTTTGACLNVASPVGIPPTFDLSLDSGRTLHPCRVAWRKTDRIGVAFEKLTNATCADKDW
jgi:PilZ domain